MGSLASGFGQPLHPMAVTSLPTSLRRRSRRLPATPGSPISPLRCCRSPEASRLPGRGRCRLTTRSSPIRMTKTFPSCRYPLRRLTRMAAPFGRVGSVESPLTRMIRHTAGCRSRSRSHWYGSLMCPGSSRRLPLCFRRFRAAAGRLQLYSFRPGPVPGVGSASRAPGVLRATWMWLALEALGRASARTSSSAARASRLLAEPPEGAFRSGGGSACYIPSLRSSDADRRPSQSVGPQSR